MTVLKKRIALALLLTTIITYQSHGQAVPDSSVVEERPEIFTVIEVPAQPEGGLPKFYKFIAQNLQYPKLARKKGIEGKVYVQFVVERDGTISDVAVLIGIGGGCDEEAVRVVSMSPKWIPGMQKGKPVRQMMVLPMNFALKTPRELKRTQKI
jgi:periplasmic protein TonB